jgi:DNA-3-methyladenine glycosylase I
MNENKTYCDYVKDLPLDNIHRIYHDTMYGFPLQKDNELFERLVLEINQAGLSWNTILNKMDNFKKAYSNFDVNKVSSYTQEDIDRLLNDAGIIRNKLKINAAINNAKVTIRLQNEFGSFKNWLDNNKGLTKDEWVKLFKKTFTFTGGEIVNEFLMSTGYLPGAHSKECPIYKVLAD